MWFYYMYHFVQEAECEKAKMDVVFCAQTNVADYERAYLMSQAAFQKEVNAAVSKLYPPSV